MLLQTEFDPQKYEQAISKHQLVEKGSHLDKESSLSNEDDLDEKSDVFIRSEQFQKSQSNVGIGMGSQSNYDNLEKQSQSDISLSQMNIFLAKSNSNQRKDPEDSEDMKSFKNVQESEDDCQLPVLNQHSTKLIKMQSLPSLVDQKSLQRQDSVASE